MNESVSSGKSCPSCRLINPSTTKICDYGYNFKTGKKERIRKDKRTEAPSLFKWGLAILGCFVAIIVIALGVLMYMWGSVYGEFDGGDLGITIIVIGAFLLIATITAILWVRLPRY